MELGILFLNRVDGGPNNLPHLKIIFNPYPLFFFFLPHREACEILHQELNPSPCQ